MLPELSEPNFYLLGFMGAGKSTVGPLFADKLHTQLLDLDALIEDSEKATIGQIFETRGEPYFRQKESELLVPLTWLRNTVVALGGGTFVLEVNRAMIRASGMSIWLDVPFPLIQKRIQNPLSRPVFRSPQDMEKLFFQRLPYYQMADVRIGVADETPEEAAKKIFQSIQAVMGR